MPTSLDTCISGLYTPGNIPASAGQTPTDVTLGSLLDPDNYDPDDVEYSLDYSKFYNSGYLLLLMV